MISPPLLTESSPSRDSRAAARLPVAPPLAQARIRERTWPDRPPQCTATTTATLRAAQHALATFPPAADGSTDFVPALSSTTDESSHSTSLSMGWSHELSTPTAACPSMVGGRHRPSPLLLRPLWTMTSVDSRPRRARVWRPRAVWGFRSVQPRRNGDAQGVPVSGVWRVRIRYYCHCCCHCCPLLPELGTRS
jgi:hypothetical protein